MSSVKLIFNERKITQNGEVPLWIRIIKDRKPKYIALHIKIKKEFWDFKNKRVRKSYPNSQYMNNFITQKLAEAEAEALKMEADEKYTSSAKIKGSIMGTNKESYYKFAQKSIDKQLRAGKMSMHHNEVASLSKLKKFVDKKDLLFFDITVPFLKDFEEYLYTKRLNKANTVYSNLKIIRKHFYSAEREELIPMNKNPFKNFKIKQVAVDKCFLTEDELTVLEEKDIKPKSRLYNTRNLYIFACYTGGIRFSDLLMLKWGNFDGTRLTLVTRKTGEKLIIKVPNKALEILNIYKKEDSQPSDYIFPYFKNDVDYSDPQRLVKTVYLYNGTVNKDLAVLSKLCNINKHIHFHTSRHTFATIALKKGMRIEYVSKLLTHSNIKTTYIYAKIISEELEKAMDIFN